MRCPGCPLSEETQCCRTSTEAPQPSTSQDGCDEQERPSRPRPSRSTDATFEQRSDGYRALTWGSHTIPVPSAVVDWEITVVSSEPVIAEVRVSDKYVPAMVKEAWYFAGLLHYVLDGADVRISYVD